MNRKRKSGLQRGLSEIVALQTAPKPNQSASLLEKFRESHTESAQELSHTTEVRLTSQVTPSQVRLTSEVPKPHFSGSPTSEVSLTTEVCNKDKSFYKENKKKVVPAALDLKACPDCNGTGLYYPEGTAKGVAKCKHAKLTTQQ